MVTINKLLNNNHGFTLIELIMVIAVLGILSGIAIPRITGIQDKARYATGEALLANMKTPLELYRQDKGDYPTMSETTNTSNLGNEVDKYIDNYSNLLPDDSDNDWSFVKYESSDGDSYTLEITHPNTSKNLIMTPGGINEPN